MNSRWKGNLIIFAMTLVPTRFDGQLKLGFLVPSRANLGSNLVKVDENHRVAQVSCRNMKMSFWDDFD